MKQISNDDLTDLKKKVVNNPSAFIKFTLELLAICLNASSDWANCIKVLNRPDLAKSLKKYDINEIKPSTISKIKKKMADGDDQFSESTVAKATIGAQKLFRWMQSLVRYCDIHYNIEKGKFGPECWTPPQRAPRKRKAPNNENTNLMNVEESPAPTATPKRGGRARAARGTVNEELGEKRAENQDESAIFKLAESPDNAILNTNNISMFS